jgi:DNA-binding HxlR family transcriptional regulator
MHLMALGQHRSPLARALERVGDKWTLLVVDALLEGPSRFNDLGERIAGIAPNILSQRLKHLEREGLVVSRPYSARPVRLAYELTAPGKELAGAMRLLARWGAGSGPSAEADALRHGACGSPLEVRWFCPTCARTVQDPAAEEVRYL